MPMAGYWPKASSVVIAMILVVAVRLHEFVPLVSALKPVLLVAIGGAVILMRHSPPAVQEAALRHPLSRLMIAYFCWLAVTVPFALWPTLAFNTWKGLLPIMLMMVGILFCAPTRASLQRVQTGFVVMVLLYSAYAQLIGRTRGGRMVGAGGAYDANDMAVLMAIAFPMAAGMLTRSVPGRARIAAILAVLALGLGVIATGSRGGALALLAGGLVFALGFRGGRLVMVIGALTVAGLLGWFTASPAFRDRMRTLTNLEEDYNYTHDTGRKAVWARGRGYARDHPLIGVGAGNFPIAEGGALEDQGRRGKWNAAHNAYIQAFAELGVPGGLLFVGMLVGAARFARPMWRGRPATRGRPPPLDLPELMGALAAFCAGSYFLSHAYFAPGFVIVGIIALADRVRAAENVAQVPSLAQNTVVLAHRTGERGGLAFRAQVPPPRLAP